MCDADRRSREQLTKGKPERKEPSLRRWANEKEDLPVIQSEELLAGNQMIIIEHAGEAYRLLVTRNNRLILQK